MALITEDNTPGDDFLHFQTRGQLFSFLKDLVVDPNHPMLPVLVVDMGRNLKLRQGALQIRREVIELEYLPARGRFFL